MITVGITMFRDRKEAGQKLALALNKYKDKGALVLAIPRGGVEVGCEVAHYLNAGLSIVVSRKLPFPDNPEAGFGAVAEDGSLFIFEEHAGLLPKRVVEKIIEEQKDEINRRIAVLRRGMPLPEIRGKTVILVDDGIAMGSTMRASIKLCNNKKAKKVIIGAPVAAQDIARKMARLADEVVILEKPLFFQAVAQAYENWYDVPESEVIEILNRCA